MLLLGVLRSNCLSHASKEKLQCEGGGRHLKLWEKAWSRKGIACFAYSVRISSSVKLHAKKPLCSRPSGRVVDHLMQQYKIMCKQDNVP